MIQAAGANRYSAAAGAAGRSGFDKLARHYGWMEHFLAGALLQRCRTRWLDALQDRSHLLLAGAGRGRLLHAIVPRFPQLQVTCLDASRAMLAHAEASAQRAGLDVKRISFIHARLPHWRPAAAAPDAIATPFFLDCFPPGELHEVVSGLASTAAPTAVWLLADFTIPASGAARLRARGIHALMYLFFRAVTGLPARRLTPPDPFLTSHGFTLAARATFNWGLLHSDLWSRESNSAALDPPMSIEATSHSQTQRQKFLA